MIHALPEVRGDDGVEDGAVQSERLVDRFAQQPLARLPGIGEPCLGSGGLAQIGRRRPAWPQGLRVPGDLADQQGGEQAAGGFPGPWRLNRLSATGSTRLLTYWWVGSKKWNTLRSRRW